MGLRSQTPDALSRRLKVLLIDDSEVSVHMVQAVLERAGFDVRGATGLDDFDRLLRGWCPDLILTDVQMPGVTGVQLCRLLKRRYETAHVPVVLFSSLDPSALAVLARQCEADAYLCKVDGLARLPDELAMLVESILW